MTSMVHCLLKKKWLLAALLIVMIGVTVCTKLQTFAATNCDPGGPYGTNFNCGYFTNISSGSRDYVFEPIGDTQYLGITPDWAVNGITESSFIAGYQNRLFDTTPVTGIINEGRAAAAIDIMLGVNRNTFGDNQLPASNPASSMYKGIQYAQAHWQAWVSLIEYYDSSAGHNAGYSVDFNVYVDFAQVLRNSPTDGYGVRTGSPVSPTLACDTNCVPDLAIWTNFTDGSPDEAVVFSMPGNKHFYIKDKCANLTGDTDSLAIPASTITLTKSSTHPTSMPVGTKMDYNITATETQDIPLSTITIQDTIPSQFKYVGVEAGYPAPSSVNGNSLTWTFTTATNPTVLNDIAAGGAKLGISVQAMTAGNNIINTATGIAVDSYGNRPNVTSGHTTNTIQNSVVYQCGNISSQPNEIQPGAAFTVTVNDNYSGGTPEYTAFKMSVPSVGFTTSNGTPITRNTSALTYTTPTIHAPPAAGLLPVTWQLYDGTTVVGPPCNGDITITDLPYFSTYGSDVSSGGDFNACTNSGGLLGGWYDGSTAYAGASTLFAALATGLISGFASGQNTATGPPTSVANNLTFANTTGSSGTVYSTNYGGKDAQAHCLFTPEQPALTATDGSSTMNIGSTPLNDGSHSYRGNVQLNGGTVPLGKNIGLYVSGNVYITSNIIYGTGAGGVWTINSDDTANVPSFTLVDTGGNIYIAPGVSELDGIYVAETVNGHGGTIYTCGQNTAGSFTPMAAADLYSSCNSQLSIYGSFIADQVNLMRTFGTLGNATATESPRGSRHSCTNGTSEPVCASEVFDFSPELYLSSPQIQLTNNGDPSYDSATSLPPVL
jgi:hypothetical protein